MKNIKFLLGFVAMLFLFACSPKIADSASGAMKEVKSDVKKTMRSEPPKAGAARNIEIGDSDSFELANGMKVIVVENHKLPRVSFQLFMDRDYISEGDFAGLGQLAGDLLSKGTTTRSKAEIDEAVDYIGASMSSSSRGGFASSLTKHSEELMGLFSDVILNPSFPVSEFEKSKSQTLSNLQTQKDDPSAISSNVSSALTYGKDHPYGEIVTERTVSNITLEKAKEFYQMYFKPNVAYMVVVGDITPDKAKSMLDKYFGKWAKGDVPEYSYKMPVAPAKTTVNFVDKPGAVQSVINITYPVDLKPGHPDVLKSRVMNDILGSGFSGRLFTNLREDKAYTYGAYSSIGSDELVGRFSANASVRNEVTDSSIVQFLYELNRLKNEPVTNEEITLSKNSIAGSFARSLESPQTVANFALNTSRYNLPSDYYSGYLARLDKVSVADVKAMAMKYIRPDQARIIVVGNSDEEAEKLARFDQDNGKVKFYDYYGNEKKMEDSAAPSDMSAADVVSAYIKAIGGAEALAKVKTIKSSMGMDMMGQAIDVSIYQKAPNKFLMQMTTQGMTVMKQVYDGKAGAIEQMGQKQTMEGDMLEGMAEQAILFPELKYASAPYSLELKGTDDVDGESAYKVIVTNAKGDKTTEYYSVKTGFKIKSIGTSDAGGQSMTITNVYGDYKEVGGVKLPHKLITTGAAPMPIEMNAKKIEVNVEVADALFKVN